ncbi:hypothetical protein V6N13_013261 [Hibiscus sabdariffa]
MQQGPLLTSLQQQQRLCSGVDRGIYTLHTDASVRHNIEDGTAGAVFRDGHGNIIWYKATILSGVDRTHTAEFYAFVVGVRGAVSYLINEGVKYATLITYVDRKDLREGLTWGTGYIAADKDMVKALRYLV